tara:strand:+ start:133 stop:396 length:264 start_codon:yes stop_codon:yes gene_type:complete
MQSFSSTLEELGLTILKEVSTSAEIYASELPPRDKFRSSLVNVTISWASPERKMCQVQVRSSEPMLKRNTRCEQFSIALKKYLPPIS